jgi:anti-anti-sigma factor
MAASVLAASGAVDMAASPQFRAAIVEALADDPAALVIDLLGVEFFGSAGVSVLVETRDGVASDMRFAVVAAGPVTGRVLQLLKARRVSVSSREPRSGIDCNKRNLNGPVLDRRAPTSIRATRSVILEQVGVKTLHGEWWLHQTKTRSVGSSPGTPAKSVHHKRLGGRTAVSYAGCSDRFRPRRLAA